MEGYEKNTHKLKYLHSFIKSIKFSAVIFGDEVEAQIITLLHKHYQENLPKNRPILEKLAIFYANKGVVDDNQQDIRRPETIYHKIFIGSVIILL